MPRERRDHAEIVRESRLNALALNIRRKGEPLTLTQVLDGPHKDLAGELFTRAAQRAELLGTTLAGLSNTISADSPKLRALAEARSQTIQEIRGDPLFGLTRAYLRGSTAPVPSLLLEAEEALEVGRSKKRFTLGQRPYGGTEAPVLRMLYLASEEYPLSFNTIAAFVHPRIQSNTNADLITRRSLQVHVPSGLERFNPEYTVFPDPRKKWDDHTEFYLKYQPSAEAHVADAFQEKEKPSIAVLLHEDNEYFQIYGKHILLKRNGRPIQTRNDGLMFLRAMSEHPDQWYGRPDLDQILVEALGPKQLHYRYLTAMRWLMSVVNTRENSIILCQQGTNDLKYKMGDFAITFGDTDAPYDPEKIFSEQ